VKELWKSVNIWRRYGQWQSVTFFWDTVYLDAFDWIHFSVHPGLDRKLTSQCDSICIVYEISISRQKQQQQELAWLLSTDLCCHCTLWSSAEVQGLAVHCEPIRGISFVEFRHNGRHISRHQLATTLQDIKLITFTITDIITWSGSLVFSYFSSTEHQLRWSQP